MQREFITNEAWIKMLKFFKADCRIHICSEEKLRSFIEAIYWIARTGSQWRMLPEKYGLWNSIFKRFIRWTKKGVWKDLMEYSVQEPDLEYIMIDSTIVRAHACAAGYGDKKIQGLGRNHGGFSCKIHAKVDALGNPLKFAVTPGQQSDYMQATYLLGQTSGAYILCDRGYDSDDFRCVIISQNNIPVIPGKSNRKVAVEYDKHIYKERHIIECFFSKIKYFRRVFSRYDKAIFSFISFLYFVGTIIWLK
jgi:transposase